MNLQDFISESLQQIAMGALDAHNKLTCKGGMIPDTSIAVDKERFRYIEDGDGIKRLVQEIEFDIALTISEKDEDNIGGGLKIASLFHVGADSKSCTGNETVNRVHFKLPFVLPYTNSQEFKNNGKTTNEKS